MIMEDIEFSDAVKERFGKIYGLAGKHSGVQMCSWTRKALRGTGVCYKQNGQDDNAKKSPVNMRKIT